MIKKVVGFTLVEILITMIIVGLVSATLLQSAMTLFNNYVSVSDKYENLQRSRLPDHWYRSSVEGLIISLDQEFTGEGDYFVGYSLSSLNQSNGLLTKIRWSLRREGDWVKLEIAENDSQAIEVTRWQATAATFSYQGPEGVLQDNWPASKDEAPQLPLAIHLNFIDEHSQTYALVASTELRRFSKPDYRDVL